MPGAKRRLPAQSKDIAALPVQTVSSKTHVGKQMRCPICLDDFIEGDSLKTMPCMHIYHSKCIDRWLATDNSCPICKTPIGQEGRASVAAAPRQSLQVQQLSQRFTSTVLEDDDSRLDIADELPDGQRWVVSLSALKTDRRCMCSTGRLSGCDVGQSGHTCIRHYGSPAHCRSHTYIRGVGTERCRADRHLI
jgi:hypothetical protein